MTITKNYLLSLAASVALAGTPLVAAAQAADRPAYATPESSDETVHGTVTSFDGKYALQVRDDRGFIDRIELHQGTIINPTGLELEQGQHVTVLGHSEGTVLSANEIDTPYTTTVLAYPGYGYGYGYPGYFGGYPYYGSSVRIGFGFGGYGRHFR